MLSVAEVAQQAKVGALSQTPSTNIKSWAWLWVPKVSVLGCRVETMGS